MPNLYTTRVNLYFTSFYIDAVEQTADPSVAVATVFSVMRSVSVPWSKVAILPGGQLIRVVPSLLYRMPSFTV